MPEDPKAECARKLDRAEIDPEFLPFLDRVNALPYAATRQCCSEHMFYTIGGESDGEELPEEERPHGHTDHWGYLQLVVTGDVADYLHEQVEAWDWLWVWGSQLFIPKAGMSPWSHDVDGSAWPKMPSQGFLTPVWGLCRLCRCTHKV